MSVSVAFPFSASNGGSTPSSNFNASSIAFPFSEGGAFFRPQDPNIKLGLDLDKIKFTTLQGDTYTAFDGTDNLTEMSFKPFFKGDLAMLNGLLDLTANSISYVEVESTDSNGAVSVISSQTSDIQIENENMYAKLGRLSGTGTQDIKISVFTTDGRKVVLAGPKMPSAPKLTLFT